MRNPDQTPQSPKSDLGLHCLPVTLLVSRLQWVKPQLGHKTFIEIDHKIISTVILPTPLIQEGQLQGYCWLTDNLKRGHFFKSYCKKMVQNHNSLFQLIHFKKGPYFKK